MIKQVNVFTVAVFILSFARLSLAQRPAEEYKIHNIGNIWTAISNFGNYGDPNVPQGLPSFEWPGGSGTHYLWEGRLWIGAVVNGDTMVSHADYGNYEFRPSEGSMFLMGDDVSDPKSDQDSKVEFDDFDPLYHSTEPLNIRILQRGMVWKRADYNDFIIYEYYIINEDPENTLENLYVGWNFDCDIGTGTDLSGPGIDDLVGWDATDRFSYMWDGNDSDTPEDDTAEFDSTNHYYKVPGYIGQKLLYSPIGDEINSHYYWNWENDPSSDRYKYRYMSSNEFLPDPDYEFDWRWLQSTGPFNLLPGDTVRFVTGIALGVGLDGLRENIRRMNAVYINGFMTDGLPDPAPPAPYGFHFEIEEGNVHLYWTPNVETDLMGYNIYRDYELLTSYSVEKTDFLDTTIFSNDYTYAITAIDSNGSESSASSVTITFSDITERDSNFLVSSKLKQNYPNPFNPITTISYDLPKTSDVTLQIYDIAGRLVETLVNQQQNAGNYQMQWDASLYCSGVYLYRIQVEGFQQVRKMLLIK